MAEKRASLIIELKDFATKNIVKLNQSLEALKTIWSAVSGVVNTAIQFAISSLNAFGEQEKAISKLVNALKNQGITAENVSKDMISYAEKLEAITAFSDENIIASQAMLTTFGIAGKSMKEAEIAALNLAAGLDVDLHTATMMVGKAFVGQTTMLGKLGFKFVETESNAQTFARALDQINGKWGGAAEAQAKTYLGRVQQLKDAFSNLQEEIGLRLNPTVSIFIELLKKATNITTELIKKEEHHLTMLGALYGSLKNLVSNALGIEQAAHEEKKKMSDEELEKHAAVMAAKSALDSEKALKDQEKKAADEAQLDVDFQNTMQRLDSEVRVKESVFTNADSKQMAALKAHAKEINLVEKTRLIESLKEHGKYVDALALQNAVIAEAEKLAEKERVKQNEERVKNLESTLNFISSLSTAKNKELAIIGKASAIAVATMDTFAAANRALASAPPPWSFALAAAVTAAGMANVARIGGVEMAHGGMVMPRAGGIQATIGEAGSREAVIPLDDPRTTDSLRETIGGGATININAGVIVADQMSVNEFAEKIDEALFRSRRNGKSVVFD